MLAVKSMDIRTNFKDWCQRVTKGETVVISRPKNENIYMISEVEYNELQKSKRNAIYLSMLEESKEQIKNKNIVTLEMEDLENMENE